MKSFTYYDYIDCIHTLRLNAVFSVAEKQSIYKSQNENIGKIQDKPIQEIFKNKVEITRFINGFLNPKRRIMPKEISFYIRSKNNRNQEDETIYRLKEQNVYFLIHYLSSIDTKKPHQLLNSCISLMQELKEKNEKKEEYPIIVPIILYTGLDKWENGEYKREKSN